ncbi:hypothetical protein ES708_28063 [subsurface metagenome]
MLDGEVELLAAGQLQNPLVPGGQLFFRKGIAQREQGIAVFDDAESLHGRRAHALGGGIGGEKAGIFRLKRL